MSTAYGETLTREDYIRGKGYTLVSKWECDWVKEAPALDQEVLYTVEPRDAFFGGRTNAICLKRAVGPGEKIRYIDVCSLYPYINKVACYPRGHPRTIRNCKVEDLESYFGLVYCQVLPLV